MINESQNKIHMYFACSWGLPPTQNHHKVFSWSCPPTPCHTNSVNFCWKNSLGWLMIMNYPSQCICSPFQECLDGKVSFFSVPFYAKGFYVFLDLTQQEWQGSLIRLPFLVEPWYFSHILTFSTQIKEEAQDSHLL
jgi:hypothetical protein